MIVNSQTMQNNNFLIKKINRYFVSTTQAKCSILQCRLLRGNFAM